MAAVSSSPTPTRTGAKLAYVALMLALVSVGTVNQLVKILHDAPLSGVEEGAKKPSLGYRAVVSESFQHDFTAWFEQHWGLRGYAVRTDNTLVQHVFGETRTGPIMIGGGVLVSEEDLVYANRTDGPAGSIAHAKNIARVQRKLLARGKVLVPVVIPSKTSAFAKMIPASRQKRGAFGRSDETVYRPFVETLRSENARFVDARAILTDGSAPERIFAPTGRHWRMSAGCRVLEAVVDVARPDLPEVGDATIDCSTFDDPSASLEEEDYDLFRLLNSWDEKPAGTRVGRLVPGKAPDALKVPTLFVGSSFVWKFVRVSQERDTLQPSLFYYYDSSVVDTTTLMITKKVEPFTEAWRKDTFGKRLFVLGILETFLPDDGVTFVAELEKELDASP